MAKRAILVLLAMQACALAASSTVIQLKRDTTRGGPYAEDSLVLSIQSSANLPALLGLVRSVSCSTTVNPPVDMVIPGLTAHVTGATHKFTWAIGPGRLDAGPICLKILDVRGDSSLGRTSLALNRPSRQLHSVSSTSAAFPWTLRWQRPSTVPWTKLQVVERDSIGSAQERILFDVLTQESEYSPGTEAGAWLSPSLPHWIRLANAYDSSDAFIDRQSWIVAPFQARFDSLATPVLKGPDASATLSVATQGPVVNFLWQTVNGATQYQLSLYRKSGNTWMLQASETTSDSSLSIGTGRLSLGTYRWTVSASNQEGQRSQSPAREFSFDGSDPVRLFRVTIDGRPSNGARLQVLSWQSPQAELAVTGPLGGRDGMAALHALAGRTEVTVEAPGLPRWVRQVDLPADSSIVTELALVRTGFATLQAMVVDQAGAVVPQVAIELSNDLGGILLARSASDGRIVQKVTPGKWKWRMLGRDGNTLDSGATNLTADVATDLGTLHFRSGLALLEGRVASSTGAPVARAQIAVLDAAGHPWKAFATTDAGTYSLDLPSGRWNIDVSAIGMLPQRKEILVTGYQTLDFTLLTGSLLVNGSCLAREEPTIGDRQTLPLAGIEVLAWDSLGRFDTLRTQASATGSFRFLLPGSGVWNFSTQWQGWPSQRERIEFGENTGSTNLSLVVELQARIEGVIASPTASADSILTFLFRNGQETARVFARHDSAQTWKYRFRNIAPGDYQVMARLKGFRQDTAVQATVLLQGSFQGRGTVTADTLKLSLSTGRLAVVSTHQLNLVENLSAHLHLLYPGDSTVKLPDTLSLGGGKASFRIIPDTANWIPLWQKDVVVPDTGLLSVTTKFPAYHYMPKALEPSDGDSLSLALEIFSPVDSAFLWVQDSVGNLARMVRPVAEADSLVYTFAPRQKRPHLTYWFEVFADSGNSRFFNPPPLNHFDLPVHWPALPFKLRLNQPDTLRALVGANLHLSASASTLADQQDYSALLAGNGVITWTADPVSIAKVTPVAGALSALVAIQGKGRGTITMVATQGAYADTVRIQLIAGSVDSIKGAFHVRTASSAESSVSGDRVALLATVRDSVGTDWRVPVQWSLIPSEAGTLSADSLSIDTNFIGPCLLKALFHLQRDSLEIPVAHWVQSLAKSQELVHDSLVHLQVPDSAWTDGVAHRLQLVRLSSLTSLANALEGRDTLTSFFNLRFPDMYPARIPRLGLLQASIPGRRAWPARIDSAARTLHDLTAWRDTSSAAARTTGLKRIVQGDNDTLPIDTVKANGRSWLMVSLLNGIPSFYGLMVSPDSSRRLEMHIMPNPFSPWVTATVDGNSSPGTEVRFVPYAPGKSSVVVRLEILGMGGDPVRMLVKDQVMRVGPQVAKWDGFTDDGKLVRNGRYLALLTLRETAGGPVLQRIVKPVVVFK